MSQLTDLLKAVSEKSLTKQQLEDYYTDLLNLFSQIELERAEKEKEEALWLDASGETTDAAKKRKWNVTKSGQRLIELNRFSKVCEKQLSAVKHRIFSIY